MITTFQREDIIKGLKKLSSAGVELVAVSQKNADMIIEALADINTHNHRPHAFGNEVGNIDNIRIINFDVKLNPVLKIASDTNVVANSNIFR